MSDSILSAPHFHNEEAAYKFVESRIWSNGPIYPHCGCYERIGKMGGKSTRIGVYKCYDCRKPFTVKIGTIFESSHIPLRLWLQAIFLIAASKKDISSNQLHRTLGVTLKSAWFMSHRIREAMKDEGLDAFGANGGTVEADETFIGHDFDKKPKNNKYSRGYGHKNKVFSLIDRTTGRARRVVVDNLKLKTLLPIMKANIDSSARIMTDEATQYRNIKLHFRDHGSTIHSIGRYVDRHDKTIHTNTIEGFFSIFKSGMKDAY
jgi:transposase-like protein